MSQAAERCEGSLRIQDRPGIPFGIPGRSFLFGAQGEGIGTGADVVEMQPSLTRRLCSGVPSMLTAPFRSSSCPSSRREGRTKSAAGRRSSAVQLAGMKTLTSRPVSDRAQPDLTVPCTVSQVLDDLRREDDVAEAGLCLVGTDARERFVEPGIKIAHLAVVVGVHADVLQPFPPPPDCCCALAEHIAVARVRGLREDLAGNIAVSGLAQGLEEIFCASEPVFR